MSLWPGLQRPRRVSQGKLVPGNEPDPEWFKKPYTLNQHHWERVTPPRTGRLGQTPVATPWELSFQANIRQMGKGRLFTAGEENCWPWLEEIVGQLRENFKKLLKLTDMPSVEEAEEEDFRCSQEIFRRPKCTHVVNITLWCVYRCDITDCWPHPNTPIRGKNRLQLAFHLLFNLCYCLSTHSSQAASLLLCCLYYFAIQSKIQKLEILAISS